MLIRALIALKRELRIAKQDFNGSSKKKGEINEKIQQIKGKVAANKDKSKKQEKTIRFIIETLKKL